MAHANSLAVEYLNRPALRVLLASLGAYFLYLIHPFAPLIVGLTTLCLGAIGAWRYNQWAIMIAGGWMSLYGGYMHYYHSSHSLLNSNQTLYELPVYVIKQQSPTSYQMQPVGNPATMQVMVPSHLAPTAPLPGDKVVADIALQPVLLNGNKKWALHSWAEGIFTKGTVQYFRAQEKTNTPPLQATLNRWRVRISEYFHKATHPHLTSVEQSLIYALILGDRRELPTLLKTDFTKAGGAHLLAVSGFHLSIIWALLSSFIAIRRNSLHAHAYRWIAAGILLLGLLLYTFITGANPATVRAWTMVTILTITKLLWQRMDSVQLLSLTLVLMALVNPFCWGSIGLILSGSAVWGILVLKPLLDLLYSPQNKLAQYLLSLVYVSIAAQVATLPWVIYYFGSFPLAGLLSAIPLTLLATIVILIGLGYLLLCGIPVLAWLLSPFYKGACWLLLKSIEAFAQIGSIAVPNTEQAGTPLLIALYYAVLVICYPHLHEALKRWNNRRSTAYKFA